LLQYEDVIRDPIHGYIHVTKLEEDLINTPFFQRLRLIKQTPGASWVYPSANHSRLEHCLGVMHLSGKLADRLLSADERWRAEIKEEDKRKIVQKVRLTGLLHDIGHGPFSHVFEEFLNDINPRINHEKISEVIIKQKVAPILRENTGDKWNDQDVQEIVGWLNERQYGIGSVVTESISTDTLDYLLRDAYNTGTIEYGWVDIDRILQNMSFVRLSDREIKDLEDVGTIALREDPERKMHDNMVLIIDERAIIAVESFFVSRLQMYKAVYFHRTVRAIESGIVESMKALIDEVPGLRLFKNLAKADDLVEANESGSTKLDDFLCLNDYIMLGKILDKNCTQFQSILQRKQKRVALEKPEAVSVDELAEYARRFERRKSVEESITNKLKEQGLAVNVTVDVPFPLLSIKVGRVYIKYREEGVDKISNIYNYGKLAHKLSAPILRVMIERDMLRMVEQRVFADTTDGTTLEKVGKIASEVLGGGGISPPHV
jgi:HD superfamily phosphohydrolase